MIWVWLVGVVSSFYIFMKLLAKYLDYTHENYWTKLGIPFDSVNVGFLDRATEKINFMEIEFIVNKKLKERGLDFCGVTELGNRCLYVRDPELIKSFLVKDADVWINRRRFDMSKADPILQKMLLFMEGQHWRDMRALLSPNFTTGKIKRMFECISNSADELVENLRKGDSNVEIRDTMSSYTMDVIASAFFGIEVHSIKDRNAIFARMGKKMQAQTGARLAKMLLSLALPKLANQFGIRFFEAESTDFFHRVVKETIAHREQNNIRRQDFLQLLIDYKNDGQVKKVAMDDDIIGSQAVLFMLGGFDTVETLLTFALYHMALHPELQEQMVSEVKGVMSRYEGKITYEGVNEMEFMERFMNETLRMYPPAPRLERRSTMEYQIPGTKIILPKESLVMFSSIALQMDPDFFPNPEKFDPDRFLEKDKINPYTFMPFGQGPRNCIGMRFAQIEAKTILAHLAVNFKMEPTKTTPVPIVLTLKGGNLKPKGDLFLKFTPRN